jgi:hypothetical protein
MQITAVAIGLAFYSTISLAQQNQLPLKSNDAYITEQSRIINSTNSQANQIIKKTLKGESIKIPKDWRLVSVIQDDSKGSSKNDYVLFFQDSKSAVHSIGVQNNGLLSGNNTIHIPASE